MLLLACADRRPSASPLRPDALYRQAVRTASMDDLVDEATRIRDREMHELFHGMAKGQPVQQQQQSQQAATAGSKAPPAAAPAGGKAAAAEAVVSPARQPGGQHPPEASVAAAAAGARGTAAEEDEEEEEEFDEADFKRWMVSAKAAGGRAAPLADEDTWPGGEGEHAPTQSKKRSW